MKKEKANNKNRQTHLITAYIVGVVNGSFKHQTSAHFTYARHNNKKKMPLLCIAFHITVSIRLLAFTTVANDSLPKCFWAVERQREQTNNSTHFQADSRHFYFPIVRFMVVSVILTVIKSSFSLIYEHKLSLL